MLKSLASHIATSINVADWQVANAIELLGEGATIPFIARYRKERTGELTDIDLLEIQKQHTRYLQLEDRKKVIIKSLKEQDLFTDELKALIEAASTMSEVEDIYLPYKPKKQTRAVIARKKGLEPLAKMIMSESLNNVEEVAQKYVNSELEVNNIDEALQGARDIIAEWISEKTMGKA
jgi:Transcriptional accessory protein